MEIDEKPNTEDSSSSVAVEETQSVTPVEELNDTQRTEWLKSGKLPTEGAKKEEKSPTPKEDSKLTEEEESSPSKTEVAEKDKAPESAPEAKTQEKVELPPSEARIKELLAKNKILEQRLAAKEQPPAPKPEEEQAEAPKPEDFEDIDKYLAAKVEFEVSEGIKRDRQTREAEEQRIRVETQNKEIVENWNKSVVEAKKKHPDFEEKCFGGDFNIIEGSVLDRWCLKSKLGTEVLYHYATHPEEFSKLNQIADTVEAIQEIARLEVEVLGKPKPAPKLVSDAPKPPTEVSGRGTATDDPIAEALASGDMEKYIRLSNAKERAELSRK